MSETIADAVGLEDPARAKRALQELSAVKKVRAIPPGLRAAAADAVVQAARSLLNSPVSDVMLDAWGKAKELGRYADPSAFKPDEINDFTLHEHEIALERHPAIELMLNGAPTGAQLPFDVKLALVIKSAVLFIQNARIIGAEIGQVQAEGSVKCAKVQIAKRETGPLKLTGRINFNPGYAIGGGRRH